MACKGMPSGSGKQPLSLLRTTQPAGLAYSKYNVTTRLPAPVSVQAPVGGQPLALDVRPSRAVASVHRVQAHGAGRSAIPRTGDNATRQCPNNVSLLDVRRLAKCPPLYGCVVTMNERLLVPLRFPTPSHRTISGYPNGPMPYRHLRPPPTWSQTPFPALPQRQPS